MSRLATCSFRGYCITRADCDTCVNYIEDLSNERDCVHGQLRRSCNICDYEREIAELKKENQDLKAELDRVKAALAGWEVSHSSGPLPEGDLVTYHWENVSDGPCVVDLSKKPGDSK